MEQGNSIMNQIVEKWKESFPKNSDNLENLEKFKKFRKNLVLQYFLN